MFLQVVFKRAGDGGLWDKTIAWWTRGGYCHVELWFAGKANKALTFSARAGQNSGFAATDLSNSYDVINIPVLEEDARQAARVAVALTGKPYDWLGILGFVFPFGEHDEKDRFCSEICAEVLEKANIVKFPSARWKISPDSMAAFLTTHYGHPQPVENEGVNPSRS